MARANAESEHKWLLSVVQFERVRNPNLIYRYFVNILDSGLTTPLAPLSMM